VGFISFKLFLPSVDVDSVLPVLVLGLVLLHFLFELALHRILALLDLLLLVLELLLSLLLPLLVHLEERLLGGEHLHHSLPLGFHGLLLTRLDALVGVDRLSR